jgi:uncharacterized membrane protein YccC
MDKFLNTVIKTAIATIVGVAAVHAAAPMVARWRRKSRLRKEMDLCERELDLVKEQERLERMYEAMNRARASVGLPPMSEPN